MRKIFRTVKPLLNLNIKIHIPWQHTINQKKFSHLKITHCLKYAESKKIFFNKFIYFTFIGLGTKNPEKKNKEEEFDKIGGNNWEKEKDVSHHIGLAETALQIAQLVIGSEKKSEEEIFIRLGCGSQITQLHGESKKAEVILQELVQSCGTEAIAGISCAYDMLATIAYKEGNILKAKDILERVINYLINSGTKRNDDSVIQFRLKLARILSKLGFSKDAEENFKECLEIQKLKCQSVTHDEESEILWINSLFWYGKHLSNNKKYLEAKECFDSAYKISARTKSFLSSQVMVILFNLSEMAFMGGQKDEALRYLLSAVTLGQSTNNSELGTYYSRIGLIYLSKGLLHEAKIWCENGKDKGKRSHNKNAQAVGENCIKQIDEVIRGIK